MEEGVDDVDWQEKQEEEEIKKADCDNDNIEINYGRPSGDDYGIGDDHHYNGKKCG